MPAAALNAQWTKLRAVTDKRDEGSLVPRLQRPRFKQVVSYIKRRSCPDYGQKATSFIKALLLRLQASAAHAPANFQGFHTFLLPSKVHTQSVTACKFHGQPSCCRCANFCRGSQPATCGRKGCCLATPPTRRSAATATSPLQPCKTLHLLRAS